MILRLYFDGDYVRVARDNEKDLIPEMMVQNNDGSIHWEPQSREGSILPRVDKLAFTYWVMKTRSDAEAT